VSLPRSLTADELPEDATTVVITRTGLVVASGKDARTIVPVSNGDVDAGEKEEGATGIKIPRFTAYLAALHREEEVVRQRQPGYDPARAPPAELLLIADRTTPYHHADRRAVLGQAEGGRLPTFPTDRPEVVPQSASQEVTAPRRTL